MDQYSSDNDNFMIDMDRYDLAKSLNSTIRNVIIENSRIDFFSMNDIIHKPSSPVFLNFENITYRN